MAYWGKRGRPYQRQGPKAPKTPETPAPPLGAFLQSLNREDLSKVSTAFSETAVITDCSIVASYNWLEGKTKEPAILVPGNKISSLSQNFATDKETQAGHHDGPHW
jgi:hypothetical protein